MNDLLPNFRDRETQTAIKRLVIYSLVIIVVPLSSMFLLKSFLFEAFLGYSSQDAVLYAAVIAVILVHIVLGFFVYAAWKEEIAPVRLAEEKEDKAD